MLIVSVYTLVNMYNSSTMLIKCSNAMLVIRLSTGFINTKCGNTIIVNASVATLDGRDT